MLLAVVDCEAIHTGWPQQPVNTWSSLAFVAAGIVLCRVGVDRPTRVTAAAVSLVGVGSLLFHGQHSDFTGWIHDWSITALLVLLVAFVADGAALRPYIGAALVGAAVLLWLAPASGEWTHVGLAVALVVRELITGSARNRRLMIVALGFVAMGGLLTGLGRTGGVWCEPGSIAQPHAGWHLLAAAALGAYALARAKRVARRPE